MDIYQHTVLDHDDVTNINIDFTPDVIFLFVSPTFPETQEFVDDLCAKFKKSTIIGCSTAGEIIGNQVLDSSVALTAVKFKKTSFKVIDVDLTSHDLDCYKTGNNISERLMADNLRHIFVLSDGLNVNGAELVKGLQHNLDKNISITGGLAGDGPNFEKTFVIYNNKVHSKRIVALGLYGEDLKIGFGSKGGWDSFGIERLVTKSENNVLYELDGKPALKLYKSFLGDKAKDLPGSGLLFPLSMRDEDNQTPVVRTILAVDEEN
ncbi:MAG: FIST N-terminal domain-containing protein, partial [Bacteroidota bacterium]